MIQRIQSLYLLASAILVALLFTLPIAEIAKDGAVYLFDNKGIVLNGVLQKDGLIISILAGIFVLLQVLTLFSYKNRTRQIKMTIGAVLLLVGLLSMFFIYTYSSYSGAQITFKISAIFPLIAIVFNYLAIRAIKKDDALIRSIDRIR